MRDFRFEILSFIGVLVIFFGCSENKIVPINDIDAACLLKDSTISFGRHIIPILVNNCATTGCHSGDDPQSNLNLEASVAYAQITRKGRGYIDTINPRNGVLFSSMVSTSNPMPPSGKLSNCNLALIENWMKQGAKNN